MTLHLKSRGYPFRPRLLFSSFIVVGVGFPNCVLFQERTRVVGKYCCPIKVQRKKSFCSRGGQGRLKWNVRNSLRSFFLHL